MNNHKKLNTSPLNSMVNVKESQLKAISKEVKSEIKDVLCNSCGCSEDLEIF